MGTVSLAVSDLDSGAGCAIILGMVAALLLVGWAMAQSKRRRETLVKTAAEFGGNITESLGIGNRIEFTLDDVPVEVSSRSGTRHSAFTRIHFLWTPPGILRLKPEGSFTSLREAFGSKKIKIGDPGFDGQYVTQGQPVSWVLEMLDEKFKRIVQEISFIGYRGWDDPVLRLEAGPSGFSVSVSRDLVDDPEQLKLYIEKAIVLFRHFRKGKVIEGMKILSADECASQGKCPLCANPLETDVHSCYTCSTPHHAECWNYFGGCTTYACGRRGKA